MIDVFFGLYNPPPTRDALYIMLYMFMITYHCSKGILGLGGGSI